MNRIFLWTLPLAGLLLSGCAGSRPTIFVDPLYNFGGIERVAVLPFENLSADQGVGKFLTRVFISELLAQQVFDIVEPGEVNALLTKKGVRATDELSHEQIADLGQQLKVQAFIFGTVGESQQFRTGNLNTNVVSINLRMVAVETNTSVWSAVVNTGSPGFFSRLLGLGEQPRSDVARKAVRRAIRTLIR